jgi:hypothetical protein
VGRPWPDSGPGEVTGLPSESQSVNNGKRFVGPDAGCWVHAQLEHEQDEEGIGNGY